MIFTYIIKLNQNKYYTGITQNLIKRLKQHYNGQSGFTSNFTVLSLVYITVSDNYKAARKVEVKIKRFGARKYMLKAKFQDRYYIDIKISDIMAMNEQESSLNQLKTIINLRQNLIPNL